MNLGDRPRECEPQPEAARRDGPRGLELHEHVEDAWELAGGNADARVRDRYDRLITFRPHADLDFTAVRREFRGIVEQVRDDLRQADEIAVNVDRIRRKS